jgi:hypothetical protein
VLFVVHGDMHNSVLFVVHGDIHCYVLFVVHGDIHNYVLFVVHVDIGASSGYKGTDMKWYKEISCYHICNI